VTSKKFYIILYSSAKEIKMELIKIIGKEIGTKTICRSLHKLGIFLSAIAIKLLSAQK
jgi:hypothetical protein